MKKYRKKPIVIEAEQWFPFSAIEGVFTVEHAPEYGIDSYGAIFTLEGEMKVIPGDWIIRGIKGEIYPCKNEIFELTYEEVEA